MKRKLIKKNKTFLSTIICSKYDVYNLHRVIFSLKKEKSSRLIEKKYGSYDDWDNCKVMSETRNLYSLPYYTSSPVKRSRMKHILLGYKVVRKDEVLENREVLPTKHWLD